MFKSDLKATVEREILEIEKFLFDYKSIANVNLCDFLTHNHWQKCVPSNFAKSLAKLKGDVFKLATGTLEIEELQAAPEESLKCFPKHATLKKFVEVASSFNISKLKSSQALKLSYVSQEANETAKALYSRVNSFMGEKKLYEVSLLAGVCADLCKTLNTNQASHLLNTL